MRRTTLPSGGRHEQGDERRTWEHKLVAPSPVSGGSRKPSLRWQPSAAEAVGMLGRRSAGVWQRLLFLVAASTISLSVLAMHQLAVNHHLPYLRPLSLT
jgi:hypothetical protein